MVYISVQETEIYFRAWHHLLRNVYKKSCLFYFCIITTYHDLLNLNVYIYGKNLFFSNLNNEYCFCFLRKSLIIFAFEIVREPLFTFSYACFRKKSTSLLKEPKLFIYIAIKFYTFFKWCHTPDVYWRHIFRHWRVIKKEKWRRHWFSL